MTKLDDMTREELIAYARQLEERLAEEGIGVDRGPPDWLTIEGDTTNPDAMITVSAYASPPKELRARITVMKQDGTIEELSAPIDGVIKVPFDCVVLRHDPVLVDKAR